MYINYLYVILTLVQYTRCSHFIINQKLNNLCDLIENGPVPSHNCKAVNPLLPNDNNNNSFVKTSFKKK